MKQTKQVKNKLSLANNLARLALEVVSPVLLHDTDENKAYFVLPKDHWKQVNVEFSKPQNKIRFQLCRLPFPDTEYKVEGKTVTSLTFSTPDGYEIVRGWNDENWKGIEVKLEELEKPTTSTDWETV